MTGLHLHRTLAFMDSRNWKPESPDAVAYRTEDCPFQSLRHGLTRRATLSGAGNRRSRRPVAGEDVPGLVGGPAGLPLHVVDQSLSRRQRWSCGEEQLIGHLRRHVVVRMDGLRRRRHANHFSGCHVPVVDQLEFRMPGCLPVIRSLEPRNHAITHCKFKHNSHNDRTHVQNHNTQKQTR